jgi:hypothetical protein
MSSPAQYSPLFRHALPHGGTTCEIRWRRHAAYKILYLPAHLSAVYRITSRCKLCVPSDMLILTRSPIQEEPTVNISRLVTYARLRQDFVQRCAAKSLLKPLKSMATYLFKLCKTFSYSAHKNIVLSVIFFIDTC